MLSASLPNKPAEWAPSKKPISLGIHLLHAGQGWLTPRSGACDKLGVIKYRCVTVCSSMPPALLPEVSSEAFISLQGLAVEKHVSISAVPSTASLLLSCFDVLRNLT